MRPVRLSKAFVPTLKEAPADAQVASHKLLVRAGFIRQLGAGIYDYLPLARRSLAKIEAIIREEMDAVGGQEFFLPALHPAEIWKESGRWEVMGDNMFRLKDRKGADYGLGMTHEEIFTAIARDELRSDRQLAHHGRAGRRGPAAAREVRHPRRRDDRGARAEALWRPGEAAAQDARLRRGRQAG